MTGHVAYRNTHGRFFGYDAESRPFRFGKRRRIGSVKTFS